MLSRRRVVLIAGVVVVVAAGAAGAAVVLAGRGTPASSSGNTASVTTAPVVRTDLSATTQVGGSIGYNGSYTVEAPSGASASQVSQAQQAVARDRQALSADEQAESDGSSSGSQTISADQANVNAAQSTLTTDTAAKDKACAGTGASTQACTADTQKVSQDETALTQAQQALATAQSMGRTSSDQATAKVAADRVTLQGDESTLASLQATAVSPGTAYTSLPKVGDIIRQDRPVYSVSNEPVPLLYGSIPAYRAFRVGMSDGADVGELTHDLITLGYANSLPQGNAYTADTTAAVERWQTALGLPATGEIRLGEVVFEPGPIRVTSVTPTVGAPVGGGSGGTGGGGGTVLTATSTTPIVTVNLDVTQDYLVKPGDPVSVVMPDGVTTVSGHVETVGSVATCPGGSGTGTGNTSADNSTCSSAGSGSNSTPTVTVTIALDKTSAGGATLDQAPVNVNITSQRASNVLAVPVNALLALAGGGYAVQVVTGSTSHLVAVTTGLYSNTLVQVSGAGLAPGTLVEVPSS
jgi:hypothetical protein